LYGRNLAGQLLVMQIGPTNLTAFSSLPAAVTGVCGELHPCFACVLDDFLKDKTEGKTDDQARSYKLFAVLLTQYVNSFGAAWLFSQGVMPTLASSKRGGELAPVEKYTPDAVVRLLRGFALFFVPFKVDAPEQIKAAWLNETAELADYIKGRGYVGRDVVVDLQPPGDDVLVNAYCGAGFIIRAAEQLDPAYADDATKQNLRYGEPFYMVSRMAAGKLWFLHSTTHGKCAEFGPVIVPVGAERFFKSGWCLDCRFTRIAGRWHITQLFDVLPI
jgi:hypothetical protein